jgi:hypothetical protein
MVNYIGFASSNIVRVTDEEAVKAHLEQHREDTNLRGDWVDGDLQLINDEGLVFVEGAALNQFWSGLGELIEEVLVVRSIGYSNRFPVPDAEQWVVRPSGQWDYESLPDRHLEDEGAAEDRTSEEIAEEHDQLIEFGELVAQLWEAADTLEKNGHTTVGVFETLDEADDLLNTVAAEEQAQAERRQKEIERLMADGDLSLEEALEEVD